MRCHKPIPANTGVWVYKSPDTQILTPKGSVDDIPKDAVGPFMVCGGCAKRSSK